MTSILCVRLAQLIRSRSDCQLGSVPVFVVVELCDLLFATPYVGRDGEPLV